MAENKRKDERAAYKELKSWIIKGPRDRSDRIETAAAYDPSKRLSPGIPDSNWCLNSVEFWLEIKCPKEPVRATTPLFGSNHKVSQDQKNWFLRQINSGGNVYLYIRTDKRIIVIDGLDIDDVNELTVSQLCTKAAFFAFLPITPADKLELRKVLRCYFDE